MRFGCNGTYYYENCRVDVKNDVVEDIYYDSKLAQKQAHYPTEEELLKILLDDEKDIFCKRNHISPKAWSKHGVMHVKQDFTTPGGVIIHFSYSYLWKNVLSEGLRIKQTIASNGNLQYEAQRLE